MSVVLSEHLPLLASAPDGIQMLRGLILELAVRGRLVAQDPNDEPASGLLKRIAKERARLEAEGICRKSKPIRQDDEEDLPFALPPSWEWSHLGGIGVIGSSSRVHQKDWTDQGVPFYRAREIVKLSQDGFVQNELFISETLYESLAASGLVPVENDLMVTGVGTIGVPYIVKTDDRFYFKDASVLIFKNYHRLVAKYIRIFMTSPCWVRRIHEKSMGTTVHTLTIVRANEVPVPIPPLAEQHRIVAKVDELMALCDRLEAEQADAASAHARLVETLLGTLTQSTAAADLAANWQRLAEHFDTLFTTEASIDALKQTVLQLAVTGFLVPSDITEKPATGKLGDYVEFLNGYAFKSECFTPSGVRLLRNANIGHGMCDWRDVVYLPADRLAEFDRFRLRDGDLVLSLDRPIINTGLKIARVASRDLPCLLLQRVAKVVPRDEMVSLDYLYLWFNSPVFLSVIDPGRSNGVPHISTKQIAGLKFVRPPLEEQRCIVAKVDELMALCDRLKADLATARQHQATLADTLIDTALEAA